MTDQAPQVQSTDEGSALQTRPAPTLRGVGYAEHLEPFWVPLIYRRAQRRDTTAFGLFAILAIVAGAFTLYYVNPLAESAPSAGFGLPLAAVLTAAGIAGVLVFGIMAVLDLSRSDHTFERSTQDWLRDRYGLRMSRHRVRAMARGRHTGAGKSSWHRVHLDGYPTGVRITYTDREGYRLVSTEDGQDTELPRVAG